MPLAEIIAESLSAAEENQGKPPPVAATSKCKDYRSDHALAKQFSFISRFIIRLFSPATSQRA